MEPSCILAIAYYPHPRKYATFASLGLGKRQCRVKCWELIAHVHSYSQVSCGHAIAQLMVIHLREIEGYHGWMNGRENLNEINAPKLRAALGWQPKKVVRSFGLGVLSHELVFLLMTLIYIATSWIMYCHYIQPLGKQSQQFVDAKEAHTGIINSLGLL